jgi:hypothetical protein
MNELINKLLANNMAALEGLQISGSVPVHTDLINEVIATVLKDGLPGKDKSASATETESSGSPVPFTPAPSSPASGDKPKLEPEALLQLVKRAEVKADNGRIVFEFEVRR